MKSFFSSLAMLLCSMTVGAQQLPQLGQAPIKEIVAAMTLEEKLNLVVGMGFGFDIPEGEGVPNVGVVGNTKLLVPGSGGTTYSIPRLGVETTVVADGPAGVRIDPTREGTDQTFYATGFPVETCVACSWNEDLAYNVGAAMGEEVREYGVDVLLAPALNIHRNPLCGRNYEYYSEDPLVSGKIAAAVVRGVQSQGVGTSVKHFAANNQETKRYFADSHVSQRALREIYLRGFRIVVEESQPWTIMSSYNRLNGEFTSQNRDLLTTILRDEWGFEGLVMSDWNSGIDNAAQINAGNDLLMPGFPQNHKALEEAAAEGRLDLQALDQSCERMLEYILKTPRQKGYKYSDKPDLKGHAAITRQSAAEGAVLLKNEKQTLPLSAKVKNIALFGNTSFDYIAGGTGSGDVHKAYIVSLVEGLQNAGYGLSDKVQDFYKGYLAEQRKLAIARQTASDKFFNHLPQMPEWIPTETDLKEAVKQSQVAVITLGRSSGEAFDRHITDFTLSDSEHELINSVCKAFHKAKKRVIVVLNVGGVIETASWKEQPDAILLAWQGGQEGGNTVADILKGKVCPSGKLSMTWPLKYEDVPSADNFPSTYVPDQKYLFPNYEDIGKSFIRNEDYTEYKEGIYVGYRYYDTFGKEVSYPFGYGLSYTNFTYSNPELIDNGKGQIKVKLTVTNTGKYAGKEVVQLYAKAPKGLIEKPNQELKAFGKTSLLQPGQSEEVILSFKRRDLASFSEKESAWISEAGDYTLCVGASSQDIRGEVTLNLPHHELTEKVHDVLRPANPIDEIHP